MLRQEYLISDIHECYRLEGAVRQFLLSESDQVRFTAIESDDSNSNPHSDVQKHHSFLSTPQILSEDLISNEVSQVRFNGVKQSEGEFRHFYYRLSPRLKEMLNQQTLLWGSWNWGAFYGFEDPTFYSGRTGWKEMVGSVISHEPLIYLYLNNEDYKKLDLKTRSD